MRFISKEHIYARITVNNKTLMATSTEEGPFANIQSTVES